VMPLAPALIVASGATIAVFLIMLGELRISKANERTLRALGAIEPPGDVYRAMAWAYPMAFLVMGVEGAFAGPAPGTGTFLGAAVFSAAKALKFWAMASLGRRWTYRVLVPPGAPLVTRGPYAWLRHPNYVAVLGELAGFVFLVGAPFTGLLAFAGFALLLRRRIRIEERALGIVTIRS
jgi:methyltransferase